MANRRFPAAARSRALCLAASVLALALSLIPLHALAGDQAVTISGNDQMKFDTTDLSLKVGQTLTITLTNDGSMPKAAMAHNIVILKPGTEVAGFLAAAGAHAGEYLPEGAVAAGMIAHTRMLGPGEQDTISFKPDAPGVYEYVCTFPGHAAAGMRGQITVK